METASDSIHIDLQGHCGSRLQAVTQLLRDIRKLDVTVHLQRPRNDVPEHSVYCGSNALLKQLVDLSSILQKAGHSLEAGALLDVYELGREPEEFGGLGLPGDGQDLSEQDISELLFLVSAQLESLNSAERAKKPLKPLHARPAGRRGMTMSEKILAAHDVERKGEVKPGDVIRVDVDWILASELSWKVRASHLTYLRRMGRANVNLSFNSIWKDGITVWGSPAFRVTIDSGLLGII